MCSAGATHPPPPCELLPCPCSPRRQAFCSKGTLMDGLESGELRNRDGTPNLMAILQTGEGPGR